MGVRILVGDVRDMLRQLPDESVDCVITSPPYWGLRDYGVVGQMGLEPTLGEHLQTMVEVFQEIRRVVKPQAAVWVNYGDCYATSPNGRSAADTKAAGTDDRTFRDKPFSTVGPIYPPLPGQPFPTGVGRRGGGNASAGPVYNADTKKSRIGKSSNRGNVGGDHGGRVRSGGMLKPKDLCLIPFRLAIALQEDGWWVRSRCVWGKPNSMPDSSGKYRPSTSFEEIFLLSKSGDLYYDADAVRKPYAASSLVRYAQDIEHRRGSFRAHGGAKTNGPMKPAGGPGRHRPSGWSVNKGSHSTIAHNTDEGRAAMRAYRDKQREPSRRHAGFNDRWDQMSVVEQQEDGRLLRAYEPEVWHMATAAYAGAHFATFPPALVERCILASLPKGGVVLDPFGGAGTVGMVADTMGFDAILIELNPKYAADARKRILTTNNPMLTKVSLEKVDARGKLIVVR